MLPRLLRFYPTAPVLAAASLALLLGACATTDTGSGDDDAGTEGAEGSEGGEAECQDGDTKKADDGCNNCSCSDGQWACTLMACLDGGIPEPECQPGESKLADDGCNTCTCSDGSWACTEMACAECQPGETKVADDGCNTCSCEGGTWLCTMMPVPCDGEPDGGSGDTDGGIADSDGGTNIQCVPGDTFTAPDGCNTCTCLEDGSVVCTEMGCVTPDCASSADCAAGEACSTETRGDCLSACDPSDPELACPAVCMGFCEPIELPCAPGETIPAPDGCNTCTCGADGSLACTEMACITPDCMSNSDCPISEACSTETRGDCLSACDPNDPEMACPDVCMGICEPTSELCTEGETRPAGDGCNTCTCDANGNFACTKIACPAPAPCVSDAECGPDLTCSVNTGDCFQDPACDPNGPCTDECWGFCQ